MRLHNYIVSTRAYIVPAEKEEEIEAWTVKALQVETTSSYRENVSYPYFIGKGLRLLMGYFSVIILIL